ncbi:hypothetical protein P8C59_003650 [Phyllachora maydis]|uniref:RNA helicase n=1 Tax=Phyllachora maydis TaxID=1825666 RepID=A0AAD9I158_9PEZI|nr:hypothetical protein P8C59_003650 [Phyllachora maydis]
MADLASRITDPADAPAEAAQPPAAPVTAASGETTVTGGEGETNLFESKYEVEVTFNEEHDAAQSFLYSATTFEELNLHPEILRGLLALNFKKPSKIQEKVLPVVLADPPRNLIAQSQSGTGKTAAFVLTCLSRVDREDSTTPQALILGPTRELARQIEEVVKQIGQFLPNLKTEAAVPGNVSRDTGVRSAIVTGTPGTVMDLIRRRQFDVSKLKVLVIDEADNMLDMQGLGDQCTRVKNMLPPDVQVLLFSATFPDQVIKYAEKFAPKADQMRLRQQDLTVRGISQMYMDCPTEDLKYEVLCKLYGLMTIGSSVIFVRTRESASEIQRRMEADVLITTNVLARGIDVSSVSMVINYDIPMKGPPRNESPDAETYLHRIGRTGRFGRVGCSITFVHDKRSFNALQYIANLFQIDLVQLSPDDWDVTEEKVKEVLKSARAQPDYVPDAAIRFIPGQHSRRKVASGDCVSLKGDTGYH